MPIKSSHSMAAIGAIVDGLPVQGFWEGDDVVNIVPVEDEGSLKIGADGSGIFSSYIDDSKQIELMLQPNSPTHRQLEQKLARQNAGVPLPFPVSAFNLNSGENGDASNCYIMSQPDRAYGKEATVRKWVIIACDWRDV